MLPPTSEFNSNKKIYINYVSYWTKLYHQINFNYINTLLWGSIGIGGVVSSTLWIGFSTTSGRKSCYCFMFELLTSEWGVTTPT